MSGSVSLDHFVKVLSGGVIVTDALVELRDRKVQEAQGELAAEIGRLTKVGLHSEELSHAADELEQARQAALRKGDNRTKVDALERVKAAGRTLVGDVRRKVDGHLADQQSYLDKQEEARAALEAAQGMVERISDQPSQQKLDGKLQALQQLFVKLSSTSDAGLLRNHARELESCALEAGRLAAAAGEAKPAAGRTPITEAESPGRISLGTSTPAGTATPTQRGTSVGTPMPAGTAQPSQPPTEAKSPRGINLATATPADTAAPTQRGISVGTPMPAGTAQPSQPPTEAKSPRGINLATATPAGTATPTQRGTSAGTPMPAGTAQPSQPPTEAKSSRGINLATATPAGTATPTQRGTSVGTPMPAGTAQPSQPPTPKAKSSRGIDLGTATPADTAAPTQPAQPLATEAKPPDGSPPGTAAPPDTATPAHPPADITATQSDVAGTAPKSLAQRLRDDPHAAKAELLSRGMDKSKFDGRHLAASKQAEAENEDISNLSEGEVVALYSYTTEDYTNMNRAEINKRKKPGTEIPFLDFDPVSGNPCETRRGVLEVLNEVTKIGLSKLPPMGETTTRRGERDWDGWEEAYIKDQTFKCQGFWSTTTANPFPGKLQITITGRGGRNVAHLSQYADENEVLYPPDTEFRVVDRKDERDSAGGLIQSLIVVVEV